MSVRIWLQKGSLGPASALKELGDSQFARHNYAHAVHIYSLAEHKAKDPHPVDSLWSAKIKGNKAAALFALQRFDEAISECDAALHALTGQTLPAGGGGPAALVEWALGQHGGGGAEALQIVRKILLRKAACETHIKEYEEGLASLSALKLVLATQPDVPREQLDAVEEDCRRIRGFLRAEEERMQ